MIRLALALLVLAGCSHAPLRVPEGGGLYPYGKYQHLVKIRTLSPAKTMEMRGVVSYTAENVKVIGLSSFNTTVFRIDENLRTGEIKKEFYLDVIRKNETRFLEFYRLIRELMTAPKGATDFARGEARFHLSDPDASGVYTKIQIDHPQVALNIEVDDYEFLKGGGT